MTELPDIPIDPPAELLARLNQDPLASVPIEPSRQVEIFNWSPGEEDEQTAPVGVRLPLTWLAIIEDLRGAVGTPFPNIFRTRSDFIKWAIWRGMNEANTFRAQLTAATPNSQPPDPMIAAHIFAERTLGMVNARNRIIQRVEKTVADMAKSVDILMHAGERGEVVMLINSYVETAVQQSPVWRSLFIRELFQHTQLREVIALLFDSGLLRNDYLYSAAVEYGAIDPLPEIDSNIDLQYDQV